MPVTEKTYEQVALEDPEGQWELVCGKLRSKPPMTHAHNLLGYELSIKIHGQVDRREYEMLLERGCRREARIFPMCSWFLVD